MLFKNLQIQQACGAPSGAVSIVAQVSLHAQSWWGGVGPIYYHNIGMLGQRHGRIQDIAASAPYIADGYTGAAFSIILVMPVSTGC
jgi:hypothetical protein